MSTEESKIQHFLLRYDRSRSRLEEKLEFQSHVKEATRAYEDMEQMYRDQPHMDIVLVGSDSLETVKKTHSTYFKEDVGTVEDFLRKVAAQHSA